MSSSPKILLSTKRNKIIDCSYYGSIYLSEKNKIEKFIGYNPSNIFFMRSLAKPLQASILADCNIIEDFKLTKKEIAIFCGSHTGTSKHIKILKNLSKRLKIKSDDLILESQEPLDKRDYKGRKNKYCNNCSGKHLMMLAMCKYLNLDCKNYTEFNHPIQKLIRKKQEELSGNACQNPTKDGCGTPLWGISAENIIKAYYNFFHDKKYEIITNSVLKNPEIYGGYDRLDTEIIKLGKGKLFSKVGAGGFVLVYNFEKDSILLIKITQNNNPIRKLIAHKALNQLKWIDTNIAEYEYNQQKEKVAKYCYEFNF